MRMISRKSLGRSGSLRLESLSTVVIDEPSDQRFRAKVQNETYFQARCSEIIQKLGFMCYRNAISSLEFQQYTTVHHHICPEISDILPAKEHRYRDFSLYAQRFFQQANCNAFRYTDSRNPYPSSLYTS